MSDRQEQFSGTSAVRPGQEIDAGRLAAAGSHAELHAANALYRSLHDRQAGGAA